MNIFANRLKSLRVEKNITQKQIAKQLGISETGYAGYEQGYREPDFNTLIKLCNLFNVTSDYLLGLEEEDGSRSKTSYEFEYEHADTKLIHKEHKS